MFQRQRRLEQQDAALRLRQHHTAALGALNDLWMIELRLEAEQAQLESAAAVLSAVTGALVAAGPRQDRHHLATEADRGLLVGPHDNDRHDRLQPVGLD